MGNVIVCNSNSTQSTQCPSSGGALTNIKNSGINGTLIDIENSKLSQFIQTALSDNQSIIRACCLQINSIPKVLPFINKWAPDGGPFTLQYGTVIFNPISTYNDFSNDYCNITEQGTVTLFGKGVETADLVYGNGETCYEFYQNNNIQNCSPLNDIDNGFCTQAIQNQNSEVTTHNISYVDPSTGAVLYNNYIDCNCVNSQLICEREIPLGGNADFDFTELAYALDLNCVNNQNQTIRLSNTAQGVCINEVKYNSDKFIGNNIINNQYLYCTTNPTTSIQNPTTIS